MEAVRLAAEDQRVRFVWNQGYNVYPAGALTTAALQAHGRHLVYCCASHGLINDPVWLTDLIAPHRIRQHEVHDSDGRRTTTQ